jgi:hypothetical protein
MFSLFHLENYLVFVGLLLYDLDICILFILYGHGYVINVLSYYYTTWECK